jgi:hypothetical protein
MAGRSESDDLKPIDNAFLGKVSELLGRSGSERTSSPETTPRRPRCWGHAEGSMVDRAMADTGDRSGGVIAAARQQGRAEQLERPSSSHREIGGAR